MKDLVGITERGDAALNEGWVDWVYKQNKPAVLVIKTLHFYSKNILTFLKKELLFTQLVPV